MNFEDLKQRIKETQTLKICGRVKKISGLIIESEGPLAKLYDLCKIKLNDREVLCEVVGFNEERVLLMPYEDAYGIAPNQEVISTNSSLSIKISEELISRVINPLGEPLDQKPKPKGKEYSIFREPPPVLSRGRIKEIFITGIRAIDIFLTLGKGQRIGIFSASGVGKSTLLGMIARYSKADVNVIALIGERGREVREFIERDLGTGLSKSVVVVATSDTSPLMRWRAMFVATTIAEFFRDKGMHTLLMTDSITRFCRAHREIGISTGEPPTTRAYPPSLFSVLPKLLERPGPAEKGTITAIYTILVEGDDISEPISDNVMAILDGHIVLSRELANRGHYPAVDLLSSVSRVMKDIVNERIYTEVVLKAKEILGIVKEYEDIITSGHYKKGTNPKIDYALEKVDKLNSFLKQSINQSANYQEDSKVLENLLK